MRPGFPGGNLREQLADHLPDLVELLRGLPPLGQDGVVVVGSDLGQVGVAPGGAAVVKSEVGSALEPNYDYGYVELVTLVNEAKDGSDSSCDSHACNYLADIDVNDLGTNAIYDSMTDTSYNLTNATQIIYSDKAYESLTWRRPLLTAAAFGS